MQANWIALVFAALSWIPSNALATQVWTGVTVSGPVEDDSRLLLRFSANARFDRGGDAFIRSGVRPGIGWRVNDGLDLWVGYTHLTMHNSGVDDISVGEDRIWQQASYDIGEAFGGKITAHTRFEQRFREFTNDTGYRARQRFRFVRPVNDKVSFILWDEIFIGFNDTTGGNRAGYQQNRVFAGFGYKLNDSLSLNAGYINNNRTRASTGNTTEHNASFSLRFKL